MTINATGRDWEPEFSVEVDGNEVLLPSGMIVTPLKGVVMIWCLTHLRYQVCRWLYDLLTRMEQRKELTTCA